MEIRRLLAASTNTVCHTLKGARMTTTVASAREEEAHEVMKANSWPETRDSGLGTRPGPAGSVVPHHDGRRHLGGGPPRNRRNQTEHPPGSPELSAADCKRSGSVGRRAGADARRDQRGAPICRRSPPAGFHDHGHDGERRRQAPAHHPRHFDGGWG